MFYNKLSTPIFFQRITLLFLAFMCIVTSFSSCTSTKETYYFKTIKKDTTISGFISNDFESKIREGDNISIIVTSMSKEEDLIFNQAAGNITSVATNNINPGFLVRPDGTVLLHRLGNVQASGFTRKEFALKLQKDLLPFMKDPIVNVNYLNHKVTVIGSVAKPQVLNMPDEQLPLLDVLVNSGDITASGKHDKVMVIREINNQKKVKYLNLEDASIFPSPWYYVQPNDIVYVLKDINKADRQERRARIQTSLALVASGVSLILIVIDRILK